MRLGIFSFYNHYGIVGDYVEYLLNDLMRVLDRLIIVVNGDLNEAGSDRLRRFSDELIIRENKGFDGGAYADVICNYLSQEVIEKYDEVVLCNDTFYGPFVHFDEMFKSMEERQLDFWGINLHDGKFEGHISSYFLVIGGAVIRSGDLVNFFRGVNPDTTDILDIYVDYERRIYREFKKKYRCGAFICTQTRDIYGDALECMMRYHMPVAKRKIFQQRKATYEKRCAILKYIRENTDYDIRYILDDFGNEEFSEELIDAADFDKVYENNYLSVYDTTEEKLLEWIGGDDFYLYGAGRAAEMTFYPVLGKLPNFKGFIVSDGQPGAGETAGSFEPSECRRLYRRMYLTQHELRFAEEDFTSWNTYQEMQRLNCCASTTLTRFTFSTRLP
jgi:hypothetical protein